MFHCHEWNTWNMYGIYFNKLYSWIVFIKESKAILKDTNLRRREAERHKGDTKTGFGQRFASYSYKSFQNRTSNSWSSLLTKRILQQKDIVVWNHLFQPQKIRRYVNLFNGISFFAPSNEPGKTPMNIPFPGLWSVVEAAELWCCLHFRNGLWLQPNLS